MAAANLGMVRTYYKAIDRQDWEATADCVGQGYVWIDHGADVVARTPGEVQAALTDEGPWQGTSRFDIEHAFETSDGALVVQGVRSGTILVAGAAWKVPPAGHVSLLRGHPI